MASPPSLVVESGVAKFTLVTAAIATAAAATAVAAAAAAAAAAASAGARGRGGRGFTSRGMKRSLGTMVMFVSEVSRIVPGHDHIVI